MFSTSQPQKFSISQLEDEASIRHLVALFADAVNRQDTDQFRSLWLPNGVWEIKPPMTTLVQGSEEIVTAFTNLLSGWEFFVQMVHSGVINYNGDRATARWCMDEIGKSITGKGFHNLGLYEDEVVRHEHGWRFARRTYHYFYIEEPTLSGQSFLLKQI